ncbi:MAG TPA: RNA-binding S4 domain-containing protein [Bacteroidales bacterium]|nr:RNA-binding S4 domain-containing protein [Bacteroidales bacterium]HPT03205.1 RNA-binding S4 domain-containing protein [Bacteroidales bacterium]
MESEHPRIDKWLWEVRLFKTRSQATEACKAGKVKIENISVKPAKEIKTGEIIIVSLNPLFKTVRVKDFPKSRLSAKLVPDYLEDLTPQEEYDRVKLIQETNSEYRDRGLGRPTKKQRRLIDKLKSSKDQWK